MQCVINLCSKASKIYNQYMHFQGVFKPQKAFAFGAAPRRPVLIYKKFTFVLGFRPQFLALEASLPLLTPISGYAYVKVSSNKQ